MNTILVYVIFNLVNVIFATLRSLVTIKCGKTASALINGGYYALYYSVIINLAVIEGIPLWEKAIIVGIENVIGVYIAQLIFGKWFTKDIRWEVRVSIPNVDVPYFNDALEESELDYYFSGSWQDWTCYSIFCNDKDASRKLRSILPANAKYNVIEDRKRL